MDKREIKQALIKALASGDIVELKRMKELLNPKEIDIFYYFGIYQDGEPTGEYFTTDGEPIINNFKEEDFSEVLDDVLPKIGAICTCFFSVEQMKEFIYKRDFA